MEPNAGTSAGLPVGTVTFLLTDIESSSRAWEADPGSMSKAVARHYEILDETIARHGGARPQEQGEGDSVVAAFTRAANAVACALDVQRAMSDEFWPEGAAIRVRIGLHTGDARLRDEGNYFGETVVRCARLRAVAHGGQVVLSRATEELVVDQLPEGASLKDLGAHRLKDLTRPEQVFQLCHPDLENDFPALRSLDALPNNLPLQLTSFIGREDEITTVKTLMAESRLVTLTGGGGCGKTRLALQVAAELLDAHPDGAWWVDLAPLADPDLVPNAVAAALSVREIPGQLLTETLVRRLREQRAVILLDSCEHLIGACAALADGLLHGCAQVSLLATSREPLGVDGEISWRVPSLSLPTKTEGAGVESLSQCESVRLFIDRAVRARPNFAVTNETAPSVAEICHRLDGIPLALELAAARVRLLTPGQIVAGLADRFRLLTGGRRTALPRQRTLEASVDWSYNLLSEEERAMLRRLSVFAGGKAHLGPHLREAWRRNACRTRRRGNAPRDLTAQLLTAKSRHSPGSASDAMRAPMCTAIPPTSLSISSHCRPFSAVRLRSTRPGSLRGGAEPLPRLSRAIQGSIASLVLRGSRPWTRMLPCYTQLDMALVVVVVPPRRA